MTDFDTVREALERYDQLELSEYSREGQAEEALEALDQLEQDSDRLIKLMNASGHAYMGGLQAQMSGRLREYIDALPEPPKEIE